MIHPSLVCCVVRPVRRLKCLRLDLNRNGRMMKSSFHTQSPHPTATAVYYTNAPLSGNVEPTSRSVHKLFGAWANLVLLCVKFCYEVMFFSHHKRVGVF